MQIAIIGYENKVFFEAACLSIARGIIVKLLFEVCQGKFAKQFTRFCIVGAGGLLLVIVSAQIVLFALTANEGIPFPGRLIKTYALVLTGMFPLRFIFVAVILPLSSKAKIGSLIIKWIAIFMIHLQSIGWFHNEVVKEYGPFVDWSGCSLIAYDVPSRVQIPVVMQ